MVQQERQLADLARLEHVQVRVEARGIGRRALRSAIAEGRTVLGVATRGGEHQATVGRECRVEVVHQFTVVHECFAVIRSRRRVDRGFGRAAGAVDDVDLERTGRRGARGKSDLLAIPRYRGPTRVGVRWRKATRCGQARFCADRDVMGSRPETLPLARPPLRAKTLSKLCGVSGSAAGVRRTKTMPVSAGRARQAQLLLLLEPSLDHAVRCLRVERCRRIDGRRQLRVGTIVFFGEERTAAVQKTAVLGDRRQVLAYQAAGVHVRRIERQLLQGKLVVLARAGQTKVTAAASTQAIVVEHRTRVAIDHHAAPLHEHRLHAIGEQQETIIRAGDHLVGGSALFGRPSDQPLVFGIRGGFEDRAAFVVHTAHRGRKRASQDLARAGVDRHVVAEREVVPAQAFRRGATSQVQ